MDAFSPNQARLAGKRAIAPYSSLRRATSVASNSPCSPMSSTAQTSTRPADSSPRRPVPSPSSWTRLRPISGMRTSGSLEFMRYQVMDSSGLPGTMSCLSPPEPEPAAPGLPGRPRKRRSAEDARVQELEDRVNWLEEELQCAMVRTELALSMPQLMSRAKHTPRKKGASSGRRHRRRRWNDGPIVM